MGNKKFKNFMTQSLSSYGYPVYLLFYFRLYQIGYRLLKPCEFMACVVITPVRHLGSESLKASYLSTTVITYGQTFYGCVSGITSLLIHS